MKEIIETYILLCIGTSCNCNIVYGREDKSR